MIKLMHTADWHIRDMQYSQFFRGQDFKDSISRVVDLAIQEEVDVIINSGDTFQTNRPTGAMLDFLFDVHNNLKEAGIPMFVITGNHDHSNPSYLKLPNFGKTYERHEKEGGIFCIDNQIVKFQELSIAGFSAIPGDRVEDAIKHWETPVDILVWHGAVREFVPDVAPYSWEMENMPDDKFRAALLGDIHLRDRQRTQKHNSLVSYPGPVELCEKGEPGEKYVDIYHLHSNWREEGFPEPEGILLDTRPVLFLRAIEETDCDGIVDKVQEYIANSPNRKPLIFMTYVWEAKSVLNRLNRIIDKTSTIFRARLINATYGGGHYYGESSTAEENFRPKLEDISDEVVPKGTSTSDLARQLVNPDADSRSLIAEWVEKQLNA